MVRIFAGFLLIHGAIHLLGFAKALRPGSLPQLTRPVSPALGWVWLAAAALFVVAAVVLLAAPKWSWLPAGAALVLSMVAIVPSWQDARFGALANAVVLVGLIIAIAWFGPVSLRATYDEDVRSRAADGSASEPVTDADLVRLPDPVQRYLRTVGVVGQPRVRGMRMTMSGRIRADAAAAWMPFEAEQHSAFGPPARFFYMTATRSGVPIQGYHRYLDREATMRIKVLGLVPVIDVGGTAMTRGETVTVFNDMCLMAPATLIDPAIRWEPVDAHTARGSFTAGGQTIRAELSFNDQGELVNFSSDDRGQVSPDGQTIRQLRWSTPVGRYASYGGVRLASHGEALWHEPDREPYAYIEIEIRSVQYW